METILIENGTNGSMASPPKVSFVVPVYNAEAYLRECVTGIRRQTFRNWELILVDDGSSDGSLALCRQLADEMNAAAGADRARVLSGANAGVSAARNKGVAVARGEFIMFCDADDVYSPMAAETLWRMLEAHPQADMAVGGIVNGRRNPFWADGRSPSATPSRPSSGKAWFETPEKAVIYTLYQRKFYHNSLCAKLIRRSLLLKQPQRDAMRYEDLELTPRLYLSARGIAFTGETVYFYRWNPQSFIHTWRADRTDALKAVDAIAETVTAYGLSVKDAETKNLLQKAARSRRFSAYFNIYNLARRHGQTALARDCMLEIRRMAPYVYRDRRARLKNRLAALWVVLF